MAHKGRKPIHLEQRGGKGNRQRIWEAIRAKRDGLTCYELARRAGVDDETVRSYLQSLINGGYLVHEDGGPAGRQNDYTTRPMKLVQDCGSEAPALCRDGRPSTQGMGNEAMWRTLRIIGECGPKELAAYASASTPVALETAKRYLRWLAKAGYVQVIRRPGQRAHRYKLAPGRYTGPRPPMIQRTRQVYDPNLAKVVWAEAPEDLL